MRFKNFIIACTFFASTVHATVVNDDSMIQEVKIIHAQSLKKLEENKQFQMPAPNPHLGKYDGMVGKMKQDGDKIIAAYLNDKAVDPKAKTANDGSKLFVFASFSMPDTLIKQYINEAGKYGGKVVIIGLVDNDMPQTQLKIREIIGDSKTGGVLIDPNLFATYKVESVPAIVLTSDDYPCASSGCLAEKFDIISGSVRVKYALESFAESGDLKTHAATKLGAQS